MEEAAAEIRRLNELRKHHNHSYQLLANDIGMPMRTLYRLLTSPAGSQRCYDRTLFKIREYLRTHRDGVGRAAKKR